jgi:predicted kinase
MATATLIIVCGLPGSGKTTQALQLQLQLPGVRFCPDEWMKTLELNLYDEASRAKIEALQWELVQQLLSLGVSVIIEWGTWARSERDALRTGARSLGARVELHYLSAPVELLFDRIQRRAIEDPPITREQLLEWSEFFQVPTSDEMRLFDEAKTIACC